MKKERFKVIVAVHLFLIKENKILLLRRFNTGYEDGNYSVIAGHIDGNESVKKAMTREAKEEGNISLKENNLEMVHVMHRKTDHERIDFFFKAEKWEGKPTVMEKDKCDDLSWFSIDALPNNTIPYIREAIENFKIGKPFSEFGW